MINITNSVSRKSKNVDHINKSARKCHSPEHYHDTNISWKMLRSVPDACALSSAKNWFAAIQFHSSQELIKMHSPESEHFEEHILVERLHTLRRIKRSNIFLGHPIVQRLNTECASYYAEQFPPTSRARRASLPEKNHALRQHCKRECLDLFSNEISLKTVVIVAIFCSSWNESHCRHCPSWFV